MGLVGGAARSPVPGAALGDLPGSRAARAGGWAGRAARGYMYPSSLAGWPLRSQRSFRRVFSGAAHEMVRALRPPRPERVPARHAPVAYYGRAGGRHPPTFPRSSTSTFLHVGEHAPRMSIGLDLMLDLSKDRGAGTCPWPVASCTATRRAGTPSCAAVAKGLQLFDNTFRVSPAAACASFFYTRRGKASPVCPRSSRCACKETTR